MTARREPTDVIIRLLREDDIDAADHIMRMAFGTFIGVPDPSSFMGDADYVHGRQRARPNLAFAAELDGRVVGSNFVTHWGSFGFFGPLSVDPALWDRGIARKLVEPVIESFERCGVAVAGLYTFAQSPKHLSLYQKFGFSPRFLTAILSHSVSPAAPRTSFKTYSSLTITQREEVLAECRRLTDELEPGLDVTSEIEAVERLKLGDTVLVRRGSGLTAFAVCHCGPGTEAGGSTCYVKFAAVKPDGNAAANFQEVLDACGGLAAEEGMTTLVAGVNTARHEAYGHLLDRGFRIELSGVAMHRPNSTGHSRSGVYVLDDWR